MTRFKYFLPIILLAACSSEPATTSPSPAPSAAASLPAAPEATPQPEVSAAAAQIQSILTSSHLDLQVNEELMLIGDVKLSDGQTLSFDRVQDLITLKNNNPELLSLDLPNRLIKAQKAGVATLEIASRQQSNIKVQVTVQISPATPDLDPNIALVNVEIQ